MRPLPHCFSQFVVFDGFVDSRVDAPLFVTQSFQHRIYGASGHHGSGIRRMQGIEGLLKKRAGWLGYVLVRRFGGGKNLRNWWIDDSAILLASRQDGATATRTVEHSPNAPWTGRCPRKWLIALPEVLEIRIRDRAVRASANTA
jgi:hypothetical protein